MKIEHFSRVWAKNLALLGVLAIASGAAVPEPTTKAWVIRAVDGDTIKAVADIWLDHSMKATIRLAGIDAPELRNPACEAARLHGEQAHEELKKLEGTHVYLLDVRPGKYARRYIASVVTPDGKNMSQTLLDMQVVKAWNGKGAHPSHCS